MKSPHLPLCSFLNSSAWWGTQDYRIDVSRKEVVLESLTIDTIEALPQDCRLQNPVEHKCDCGSKMLPELSMGAETSKGPFEFIDDEPLFIGEAALYFFLCTGCMKFRVQSQST